MDINGFWKAVLGQKRCELKQFFCDDAYINWHCTNEHFTVDEFIRANCDYPGDWDGSVERVEYSQDAIITVTRVYPKDRSASFHVTSFIKLNGDRIISPDEYWIDDGDAPKWRRAYRQTDKITSEETMQENSNRYDDIINLPHHVSESHPKMSQHDRAAQFSPFAALTGYDDAVRETARLTGSRIELDDAVLVMLDEKLKLLRSELKSHPVAAFTYFVPDEKKDGGEYVTVNGSVKRIDDTNRSIILADDTSVPIDDIIGIDGELFSALESEQ